MKKNIFKLMALSAAAALMLTACGEAAAPETETKGTEPTQGTQKTEQKTETEAATAESFKGAITVISREDGSGTRGAFIELFGIEQKDADGNKIDYTIDEAEITNSTTVMMTSVAGNKKAIGYISLGSLNDTVKALQIDGAIASVDSIKDGEYKIARPFNIAVKADNLSDLSKDYIDFIMSKEGQEVVEKKGYISEGNIGSYSSKGLTGKITIAGSSSVTPVMEVLKEAYIALNSGVTIEIQQNDSTTGMNSVIDGICEIGMASRELKSSEVEAGLDATVIAIDGIAVIVNNDNPTDNMTSEQVMQIYMGEIKAWENIG